MSELLAATGMGKSLRLARIFDPGSNTAIVTPMDHAVEDPAIRELEDPRALIASLADAGTNAFLLRRGLARFAAESFMGKSAWVCRVTIRPGLSLERYTAQLFTASVEQALYGGADAVVPTFFVGGPEEDRDLPLFGAMADECARLGMPLMAEVFPKGDANSLPGDGPYSVDDLRVAVRVASEEGADCIKTYYTGDSKSFSKVVAYSTIPILVAGGPKAKTTEDVLSFVKGAMDAGARGLVMGRKLWASRDPVRLLGAIAMIVREGSDVAPALSAIA